MNSPKRSIKSLLENGFKIDQINWDDPKLCLPTPHRCLYCTSNEQTLISENAEAFTTLQDEDRIALLTEIIQKRKLVKCIFNQNDTEFLELKLKFELENQEQLKRNAKKLLLSHSVLEILVLLGLEKIHSKGTMREICMEWGKFIFKTKNAKGELMFDIEAVDLAKLIQFIVEPPVGKEFSLHTIEGYVGEGRNS